MKETGHEIEKGTENLKEQNEAFSEQQAFENRIKQFLGIRGAAMVMRKALQDAMRTIQELDAAMTEMAVVTDLEIGDYWERLPEFTDNANNFASVSDNSVRRSNEVIIRSCGQMTLQILLLTLLP